MVLLLICLAALIAYVRRTALAVPTKTIESELGISEAGMGLIMSCWFWGYALLQIPAGWLTDWDSAQRSLVLFVTAWSLLTGLAGAASGPIQLALFWSLMGVAQTGLVPGAAKSIGEWYPPTGRALASGMLGASMALGGAIAPLIAATLLQQANWRQLLGIYVVPGLAWAFAFAMIVAGRRGAAHTHAPFVATFAQIIRSPTVYLLCATILSRPWRWRVSLPGSRDSFRRPAASAKQSRDNWLCGPASRRWWAASSADSFPT